MSAWNMETWQLIIAAIMAFTTIVYTIVTSLLLLLTKRQVNLNKETLESMRLSFYGSTWQGIVANHREIYSKTLESKDLLDMMFLSRDEVVDRELTPRERIMATIVINHAEACFLHLKFKTLPEEVGEPIKRGLVALFSNPVVRKVWNNVRPEYRVREFREFVNQFITASNVVDIKKEALSESSTSREISGTEEMREGDG